MRIKTFIKAIIFVLLLTSTRNLSYAQVNVGITISSGFPPPPLPVYVQPLCPVEGWLWIPGYWAFDPYEGYYWIPGVWVEPPQIGWLWTPPYWAFANGIYVWHAGYWGPHVGFYGGINYGWGYPGTGYIGGIWEGRIFRYNTAVTHVNTAVVHNVYINRAVINNTTVVNNRISYNGGNGGVAARPNPVEEVAMRERHLQATESQLNHQQSMRHDRAQFANVNHGTPTTVSMTKVNGHGLDSRAHATPSGPAPATDSKREIPPASRPMPSGNRPPSVDNRTNPVSKPNSERTKPNSIPHVQLQDHPMVPPRVNPQTSLPPERNRPPMPSQPETPKHPQPIVRPDNNRHQPMPAQPQPRRSGPPPEPRPEQNQPHAPNQEREHRH